MRTGRRAATRSSGSRGRASDRRYASCALTAVANESSTATEERPRGRSSRSILERYGSSASDAREDRDLRRDREVELHEDDKGDAPEWVDEAEQRAERVERLSEDDAPLDHPRHQRSSVLVQKSVGFGIDPGDVHDHAEKEDVRPVRQEGEAESDELREKRRREGHQRDGREEREMEPGEIAIGGGEVVDLHLLGVPEDPEGQEAQQISHKARTEREHRVPEVLLRSDRSRIRYVDLENDEGHRDREDTIGERPDPVEAAPRDLVIGANHRLGEERRHLTASHQVLHLVVARCRSATVRGVKYFRQKVDVARRVEEDPWTSEDEPDGDVDVTLFGQRLVPGRRPGWPVARPRRERDRLDRLNGDAAFLTQSDERFNVLRVRLALKLREVVGEEDAVEREALEALAVTLRHLETVTGHADEARKSGVACLDGGPQRAVLAHRNIPLALVDEVVQLDQINVVDAQTAERQADLVARLGVRPLSGLGREEEALAALASKPRRDVELRVAVARRRVQVVQVVAEYELERAIGLGIRDLPERGGAEDGAAA